MVGLTIEQNLLILATGALLLAVVVLVWRQQQSRTTEAHMRILREAHAQRYLQDRTQAIAASLRRELGLKNVWVVVYTADTRITHASSPARSGPIISAKEARSLDGVISGDLLEANVVPAGSFLAKLLASYQLHYIFPLDYSRERVGYICLKLSPGQKRLAHWQLQVIAASQVDIANALANAASTYHVQSQNKVLHQHVSEASHARSHAMKTLDELDAAKDEFVSMASHQLRTPLTSVKGYISMLLEGDAGKLKPSQKKLLSEAFVSSEQMVNLIGDYLNVSRIQTGKFIIDSAETDLVKIIKQEAKRLTVSARMRGIKIDVHLPPDAVKVVADEAKLRQVISNFIDNAIFYSPEKSTITVRLAETKKTATIRITDRGIGVPLAEQPKLFKKFFRASNARKHRPDGNGIGLFLAKQIIDGHHGQIIFSSVPGKGSTFGFSLPKE